jgi:hypothetical protein
MLAGSDPRGVCACCLPGPTVRAPILVPGPRVRPGRGSSCRRTRGRTAGGQNHPAGGVAGDTGWVKVVVTEIGPDGSMRRRTLDTCGLTEAGRWQTLIEQILAFPPPYRGAPGSPIYVIHAGDRAVLVGEQDLTGPLRDLVITIVAVGGPS